MDLVPQVLVLSSSRIASRRSGLEVHDIGDLLGAFFFAHQLEDRDFLSVSCTSLGTEDS